MSPPLTVLILTCASTEHGYGHLNRCLVLGEALRRAGHLVQLVLRADAQAARFAGGVPWVSLATGGPDSWPQAELCIVDLYDYADSSYAPLRARYPLIAMFDDCEYRVPTLVSAVVNPNLHAEAGRYPPGVRVFAGAQFALVRPQYAQARHDDAEAVLVCMGGSDPTDQMRRLLPILERTTSHPIEAVFGPGYSQSDVIERWSGHPRVRSFRAVTDMTPRYAQAAYAVTGAGTMLYELAAAGVPAACIVLADNQRPLAAALGRAGAVEYLGAHDEAGDAELERRLERFDAQAQHREHIAARARELVDGRGAERLAKALGAWAMTRRDPLATPYSRDDVAREYDTSAQLDEEHLRLRWGSPEAMRNRYSLALDELPFDRAAAWLDVGCGTGALQELVTRRFPAIRAVGLDVSGGLLAHARARGLPNVTFLHEDFMAYDAGAFDILTSLGVVAKASFGLVEFFRQSARLLGEGGWLMVDFKHLGWVRFREPGFFPEPRHLWFTLDKVLEAARDEGLFEVVKVRGFLPEENRQVEPAQSHSVFLVARRTSAPPPRTPAADA